MKIHELSATKKQKKRVGRGIAAGGGKTAGRGTKGQNSRSGGKRRPGFEGGQNPLYARLPKIPGFRSYKTPTSVVTTAQLNKLTVKNVNNAVLYERDLVADPYASVKLIFKGEVSKPFKLQVQAASKQASDAVSKAGGTVEIVERPKQSAKKPKK